MPPSPSPAVPDEIEVTLFPLDDEPTLPLALARSWLSADELERAERFRFERHRDRYLRGRGMMRALLAGRLGAAPGELVFTIGEKGKPRLAGLDLGFNLSHSEGRAVLAIGAMPEIGVDIEGFDRSVDLDGLAMRCFRESEIAWMNAFPAATRHRAFFHLWTAKEARMKATGEGFSLEPKRIELGFEDGLPQRIVEPAFPPAHLASLVSPDGASACCVVALTPFRVRLAEPPDFG